MNPQFEDVKTKITAERAVLADRYLLSKIGVFGSMAKGHATETSDVDILVEFKKPVDLFFFLDVKFYLENLLKKTVDLVTPGALKPLTRDEILSSVVYL